MTTTLSDPIKLLALANPVEPGSLREIAAERADDLLAALGVNQVPISNLRRSRRTRRMTVSVVLAVVVLAAALALVPMGGASLGSRAVNGISGLWATPPNQPALDRAADDAESIAGTSYYTDARVNDDANKVDLSLANAPQSVIDQLRAKHPGIYVINNDARHPLSELLRVQHSLSFQALQAKGIDAVVSYPTSEGYLKVGVRADNDVQAAQAELDAIYGPGIIKVFGGAGVILAPYRGQVPVPKDSSHTKHTHR